MNIPLALLASEESGATLNIWPDPATFLQSLILFSILALVLWKFAWPQILDALAERERHIKSEIEKAEKNRAESERLLKEYEAKLEASRIEAQKMIDEGKADALLLKDRILGEAREEGGKIVERARREIQLAEDKAIEELHRQTVELAVGAASRILERALKPEDHREIVDRFVQETQRSLSREKA